MVSVSRELFHIGIRNKIELRRSILEASKEVITLLKSYEELKEISKKKLGKTHELKQLIKEIYSLENKLMALLPKIEPHEYPGAKEREKNEKQAKQVTKQQEKQSLKQHSLKQPSSSAPSSKKSLSDIERLEQALADVEGKLSRMGI